VRGREKKRDLGRQKLVRGWRRESWESVVERQTVHEEREKSKVTLQ
jgi:hypothetical protein